jgi:hypothetical protein
MRLRSALTAVLFLALAGGGCAAMLGLGEYALVCDGGPGGCGGSGGAATGGGGPPFGKADAAP